MKFIKKPYAYASVLGLLLTGSFSYSMLKTFVLAETISTVATTNTSSNTAQASQASKTATITNSSYKDKNISINLTETTVNHTQVYVADVTVSSSEYLKTAFAQNSFGTNVTAKTSVTAADNDAILAVNGDYYGANSSGYVIRNGVVYRDTVRENSNNVVVFVDNTNSCTWIRSHSLSNFLVFSYYYFTIFDQGRTKS